MKSFEEIVKKAVGYDEGRGDQISISNVSFAADYAGGQFVEAENRWFRMLRENHKIILNLVLIVLAFFFVIRPFMRKIQQTAMQLPALPESAPVALPNGGETDALFDQEADAADRPSLRKQVGALVKRNPERATEILRAMLREEI